MVVPALGTRAKTAIVHEMLDGFLCIYTWPAVYMRNPCMFKQ